MYQKQKSILQIANGIFSVVLCARCMKTMKLGGNGEVVPGTLSSGLILPITVKLISITFGNGGFKVN
jgi:hypothetical protein